MILLQIWWENNSILKIRIVNPNYVDVLVFVGKVASIIAKWGCSQKLSRKRDDILTPDPKTLNNQGSFELLEKKGHLRVG